MDMILEPCKSVLITKKSFETLFISTSIKTVMKVNLKRELDMDQKKEKIFREF